MKRYCPVWAKFNRTIHEWEAMDETDDGQFLMIEDIIGMLDGIIKAKSPEDEAKKALMELSSE